MKKIEKILKQKITNKIESNLDSYKIKYSLNKQTEKTRRVSKNQYRLLKLNDSEQIKLKFPFSFTSDSKITNLEIKKTQKCIIPASFSLKNKNFSFDSETNFNNLLQLQNIIFILSNILYSSKNQQQNEIKTLKLIV
jgi:hypothetical protein